MRDSDSRKSISVVVNVSHSVARSGCSNLLTVVARLYLHGRTPYMELMAKAKVKDAEEMARNNEYLNTRGFTALGKDESGVSFRKSTDPNACSEVCAAHSKTAVVSALSSDELMRC